ncbi:MAG: CHAD domain-containing protein [Actinomycetes bacterium]
MATEHLEVERTYAVGDDWPAPADRELTSLPGVAAVSEPREVVLDARYLDTSDLRLLRSGVTLRRRTGGDDAGWHLKLPVGAGRLEVRTSLGRATRTPPRLLRDLTLARRRGLPVAPVARLVDHRTVRRLSGADGDEGTDLADLVELTDDRVTAYLLAPDGREVEIVRWRELEVELVDAGSTAAREVARALDGLLRSLGANDSPTSSKLARALAGRLPAEERRPRARGGSPSADAVRGYLRHQVDELTARDPAARRDEPDAVHKMRVATRRLRSTLRVYEPLLEADVGPLLDELRWLAAVLGEARDAEVMRERLRDVARHLRPPAVDDTTRLLDEVLGEQHAEAMERLRLALSSERYLALLRHLDEVVADRESTGPGRRRARTALPRAVRRQWRRVRRRVEDATGPAERFTLHDARKAAKRARYAAEVAAAAVPSRSGAAADFASAMESVQEVLGEHQDAVTATELLTDVARRPGLASAAVFDLGRLVESETRRSDEAEQAFAGVWHKASRKRLRRWW